MIILHIYARAMQVSGIQITLLIGITYLLKIIKTSNQNISKERCRNKRSIFIALTPFLLELTQNISQTLLSVSTLCANKVHSLVTFV
jgi:hypothetical protein